MKKIVSTIMLFSSFHACASLDAPKTTYSTLQLGVVAGWSTGPYSHYSNKVIPFPIISYEGELAYFRGGEAGLKLYSSDNDEISVAASLLPLSFKPRDAEKEALKSLNERKMSAMAGIGWKHHAEWGFTSLTARQRITGNKEGATLGAAYGYPFPIGQSTWVVTAGLDYSNAQLNKNYFGVSPDEASRSGLRSYSPGAGIAPYLDLLVAYPLTQSIDLSAGTRLTRLSDAMSDSPMAGKRYMQSFITSVSYHF